MDYEHILKALGEKKISPIDAKKAINIQKSEKIQSSKESNKLKSSLPLTGGGNSKPLVNKDQIKRSATYPVKEVNANKMAANSIPQMKTSSPSDKETIAIVGMSGQYPDAKDLNEYWNNLQNGKNSIKEIPKSRWDVDQYYDPRTFQKGKVNCKWLGMLDDVECFDPLFFNIPPVEAEAMDPQHRLFLQEGYKAFEDAGYSSEMLNNKNCGVYLGIMSNEYGSLIVKNKGGTNVGSTDNSYSIASARIPYFLNLKGPAIPIDTACSSSLVGIHLACQALLSSDIDMALVGGVTLYLIAEAYIGMCASGMLSPEGQCKTFDNSADGFVPGEGVGALVLKRLKDAEKDGDHIYGVIIGSGINQDGKTNGITAPNAKSQIELVQSIYKKNNIKPESISYVEMHGTGTKLGDPIELDALSRVFKEKTNLKKFCAIGSVKSNIGHTSAASGVASIQKVLSCLKHKKLVPTLNYKKPNEHYNFEKSPFYVNTELRSWGNITTEPLRAGVSSFGFSGTNAHVVIEEYQAGNSYGRTENSYKSANPVLFVLSARSEEQLKVYSQSIKSWMQSNEDFSLADMAYTLQVGRKQMDWRLAFVVDSKEALLNVLTDFIDNKSSSIIFSQQVGRGKDKEVFFENDEECQSFLQMQFQKNEYSKIAELWVKGLDIDWDFFTMNNNLFRISLPTYPFVKERYWVSKDENQPIEDNSITIKSTDFINPLLQQNTSDFSEQRFSTTFTGQEFFLTDHTVHGQHLLPGVAILEMARAAVEQTVGKDNEQSIITLKNVVWSQPIVVEDQPVEVHIALFPQENEEISFEVYSKESSNNNEIIIHSQGSAVVSSEVDNANLNIEDYMSMCNLKTLSSDKCYEFFESMGISYGPGHQGIEAVHVGSEQVLASLALPEAVICTQNDFVLHPSLLDSALQASIGFISLLEDSDSTASVKPAVPFALDSLEILNKCSTQMWALIKHSEGSLLSSKVQKFDVDLCDEQGLICIRIKGYSTRVLDEQNDSKVISESIKTQILELVWEEKTIPKENTSLEYGQHIVFLCEHDQILKKDIEIHMNGVSNTTRCITLTSKQKNIKNFNKIDLRYTDYAVQVFNEIHKVLKEKPSEKVLIQVVISSPNNGGIFNGLSAILETAHIENPQIIGQMIEVSPDENSKSIIDKLQKNSFDPSVNQIRYDGDKRQVGAVKEINTLDIKENIPWKDNGVYLITGGAGGLGFIFAREIVSQVNNPVLILIGRSELKDSIETKIEELESLGAQVLYRQVDVSSKRSVDNLFKEIKISSGRIDGIIHSAGVIKDNFIINKTKKEFLEVMNPKVSGLANLDQGSKDLSLDFFILFSSMAGVVGSSGQSDYATSNAFMNSYSKYRNDLVVSKQRSGKTISISWPLWKEGGMHVDADSEKMMWQNTGMIAMKTTSGVRAFYQSLAIGKDHILVVEGEPSRLKAAFSTQRVIDEIDNVNHKGEEVEFFDKEFLAKKAERFLKDLLSSVIKLQVNRIDADAPLEQYGINSIMVTKMTNELEKTFGSLSKTLFFEYQNITGLSGYFLENYHNKLTEMFCTEKEYSAVDNNQDNQVSTKIKKENLRSRKNRLPFEPINRVLPKETPTMDIAIIGLSGRYPQAENISEYWKNLRDGKDCITEIPQSRWDSSLYFDQDRNKRGKTNSKWGGFIDGIDHFDPQFFNISPREAIFMDPQERMFLECAYETLEDGGYTRNTRGLLNKSSLGGNVGVYVGVMYEEYQLYGAQAQIQGKPLAVSGSASSIANRASYNCNFHGPSMSIDTMCSSSLTALHLACHSLQRGECDAAIAGGVNVSLHPNKYLLLGQGQFVSSKGKCESFGLGGDGYVPGEGVGAVLLKPMAQAIADGDHIYGVIKSTAINHGGKTNGYSVPNPNAQADVIEKVFQQADVDPRRVTYIEAHGTGTSLGDPIEITGLTKAFQKYTKDNQFCAIGSAKSNIGHCESASGIAGLTKVLLQMKQGQIFPSLHSSDLNPNIDFTQTPFVVQQELAEWKRTSIEENGKITEFPRIAGISSFGAGGSNAHVVIEEYIPPSADLVEAPKGSQDSVAIVLSARNKEQLKEQVRRLINAIEEKELFSSNLIDMAYTLQVGREPMEERLGLIVKSVEELIEKLKSYMDNSIKFDDFYSGQVKQHQETLAVFTKDEDLNKAIDAWISKRKYSKLLDLWVKGLEFDWTKLYGDNKPCRTSLPTYPFVKESYWFPDFVETIDGTENGDKSGDISSIELSTSQQSEKAPIIEEQVISKKSIKISLPPVSDNQSFSTEPKVNNIQSIQLAPVENEPLQEKKIKPQLEVKSMQSIQLASVDDDSLHEKNMEMNLQSNSFVEEIQDELVIDLAEVLFLKNEDVDINKNFNDLGLDSVTGVEWIQKINNRFETSIATSKIYDYPTISEFAEYLAQGIVKPCVGNQDESKQMTLESISEVSESVSDISEPVSEILEPIVIHQEKSKNQSFHMLEDLQDELTASLAEVLFMKDEDVDMDKNFNDLGLDSVTGVEWIQKINNSYEVSIVTSKIYDYPTIREFSEYFEKELNSMSPETESSLQDILEQLERGNIDIDDAENLTNKILNKEKQKEESETVHQ